MSDRRVIIIVDDVVEGDQAPAQDSPTQKTVQVSTPATPADIGHVVCKALAALRGE